MEHTFGTSIWWGFKCKNKNKLNREGKVTQTEILDHARMNKPGQGFYKVLAESAIRATRLCDQFKLPQEKYELWKEIVFNFDPKAILSGTDPEETRIVKNNLLNKSIKTLSTKENENDTN